MQICGVEIKGSEAVFAIASLADGELLHIPTETKRIELADDDDAANVRSFSELLAGFVRDNQITSIAIKKRGKKGEYAGGATTFKIEGVFQLLRDCQIELVAAQTIAAQDKKNEFPAPVALKKYQMEAFRTACAALMRAS